METSRCLFSWVSGSISHRPDVRLVIVMGILALSCVFLSWRLGFLGSQLSIEPSLLWSPPVASTWGEDRGAFQFQEFLLPPISTSL